MGTPLRVILERGDRSLTVAARKVAVRLDQWATFSRILDYGALTYALAYSGSCWLNTTTSPELSHRNFLLLIDGVGVTDWHLACIDRR